MKCVVFLQNVWVRDPERVKRHLEGRDEKFRRSYIRRLLFAGGLTGRRIIEQFSDIIELIEFEEVSREILGDPKTIPEIDAEHVANVLQELQPDFVVTFGRVAYRALYCCGRPVIRSPHPAYRCNRDRDDFRSACHLVRERLGARPLTTSTP